MNRAKHVFSMATLYLIELSDLSYATVADDRVMIEKVRKGDRKNEQQTDHKHKPSSHGNTMEKLNDLMPVVLVVFTVPICEPNGAHWHEHG